MPRTKKTQGGKGSALKPVRDAAEAAEAARTLAEKKLKKKKKRSNRTRTDTQGRLSAAQGIEDSARGRLAANPSPAWLAMMAERESQSQSQAASAQTRTQDEDEDVVRESAGIGASPRRAESESPARLHGVEEPVASGSASVTDTTPTTTTTGPASAHPLCGLTSVV